jgi:HD-GYP domain-containing protein (c-di-GMP phosphodiesterase class II)
MRLGTLLGRPPRDTILATQPGADSVSIDVLDSMVEVLAAALEMRDDETGEHAYRVARLGLALTAAAAPELLDDPQLRYGFLLHDLGKIGVPDRILLKPHALTPSEVRQMEQHPVLGAQLVVRTPWLGDTAKDVIAFHHERWDGSGYPWGLRGEQIPLAARIFAVVDSFDAMTSERPYRKPVSPDAALAEIQLHAGRQFDPAIVDVFVPMARELYGDAPDRQQSAA